MTSKPNERRILHGYELDPKKTPTSFTEAFRERLRKRRMVEYFAKQIKKDK